MPIVLLYSFVINGGLGVLEVIASGAARAYVLDARGETLAFSAATATQAVLRARLHAESQAIGFYVDEIKAWAVRGGFGRVTNADALRNSLSTGGVFEPWPEPQQPTHVPLPPRDVQGVSPLPMPTPSEPIVPLPMPTLERPAHIPPWLAVPPELRPDQIATPEQTAPSIPSFLARPPEDERPPAAPVASSVVPTATPTPTPAPQAVSLAEQNEGLIGSIPSSHLPPAVQRALELQRQALEESRATGRPLHEILASHTAPVEPEPEAETTAKPAAKSAPKPAAKPATKKKKTTKKRR